MGRNTCSEIVQAKIEVGDINKSSNSAVKEYAEYLLSDVTPFSYNGWTMNPREHAVEFGEVYTCVLRKDDKAVHYVNEHQYSTGGGVDGSFFANDKETLEEFCRDWDLAISKIKGPTPVQQTL
jgi:hypothetical protein